LSILLHLAPAQSSSPILQATKKNEKVIRGEKEQTKGVNNTEKYN